MADVRPSAPPATWLNFGSNDNDHDQEGGIVTKRKKRGNCWAICAGVSVLVIAAIVVALILLYVRVSHARDPTTLVNSITILHLPALLGGNSTDPNTNMTIVADVSLKNPNYFSAVFGESNTSVVYRGREVGSGKAPGGISRARKAVWMNITVDIILNRMLQVPGVFSDFASQEFSLESFTRIHTHTKILNLVQKNGQIDINCSYIYDVARQTTREAVCNSHLKMF
ncbi:hypothetical protein ACFE04_007819 [Oxalis oulophora]